MKRKTLTRSATAVAFGFDGCLALLKSNTGSFRLWQKRHRGVAEKGRSFLLGDQAMPLLPGAPGLGRKVICLGRKARRLLGEEIDGSVGLTVLGHGGAFLEQQG